MPRTQDATPSWSGYIFQGEVALCKALEKINQLGEDLEDNYCLKLEEDEDFSLTTDEFETFQVKAYTAHNYAKYRNAWNDMMNRFPDNSERNYLYLQLDEIDLGKFESEQHYDKVGTNVISGEYSLENINSKIDDAIRTFFDCQEITDYDIEIKRIYCCQIVSNYIKERHRTGNVRTILFSDIIGWLNNAPEAYNEEIAWYFIIKTFLQQVALEVDLFDLGVQKEKEMHDKLQECLSTLQTLSTSDLKRLINDHLTPHNILDNNDLRSSSLIFLDDTAIQSVVVKAIKDVQAKLNPKSMHFMKVLSEDEVEHYQLTTNSREFDCTISPQKVLLQRHCEQVYKNILSKDTDYYVTRHLNISKEEIKNEHLINVTISPDDEDSLFGFKTIDQTINDLNE